MSMGVMYERLGPCAFDARRERYQKATRQYWYKFLEDERLHVLMNYRFIIRARAEWQHRLFGVTKEGIPIWGKKWCHYTSIGTTVSGPVSPEHQSEVYQDDKECQTEEVMSFAKWKKGKQKLAFIYLGIFWSLEEGETLNDAAKRFIYTHQEVEEIFSKRRKKPENSCISEDEIYLYEIFKDGALVFNNRKAMLAEDNHFFGTLSGLWAIMAAEGFFARENVKELEVGTDFFAWYRTT